MGGAEPEDLPCTCECLDLFSYDIDSSIITRIQFQDHLLIILAINLTCNCQDRRRLSRPRWTIEQHMWQFLPLNEPVDLELALLPDDALVEMIS
jgi:hypothetical protein